MVGMASVDVVVGAGFFTNDRAAHLAAAEATSVRVLSLAPNHAFAHLMLGNVLIRTNRAVAECERALALDRNLAEAHGLIGDAKLFLGRGAETEAHMREAFRLSPHHIFAFRWLMMVGFAKLQLTADAQAVHWFRRSIEANRNYPLAALALLGSLDQAKAAATAGLTLDSSFTIRRFRDGAQGDNPTYLAKRERLYQGMRMAGIRES